MAAVRSGRRFCFDSAFCFGLRISGGFEQGFCVCGHGGGNVKRCAVGGCADCLLYTSQLLDWAFQRAIRELGEMPEENWRDRLLMAVEFLRANRALAMNVYHSLGMEHLARGLEAAVRDQMCIRDSCRRSPDACRRFR